MSKSSIVVSLGLLHVSCSSKSSTTTSPSLPALAECESWANLAPEARAKKENTIVRATMAYLTTIAGDSPYGGLRGENRRKASENAKIVIGEFNKKASAPIFRCICARIGRSADGRAYVQVEAYSSGRDIVGLYWVMNTSNGVRLSGEWKSGKTSRDRDFFVTKHVAGKFVDNKVLLSDVVVDAPHLTTDGLDGASIPDPKCGEVKVGCIRHDGKRSNLVTVEVVDLTTSGIVDE